MSHARGERTKEKHEKAYGVSKPNKFRLEKAKKKGSSLEKRGKSSNILNTEEKRRKLKFLVEVEISVDSFIIPHFLKWFKSWALGGEWKGQQRSSSRVESLKNYLFKISAACYRCLFDSSLWVLLSFFSFLFILFSPIFLRAFSFPRALLSRGIAATSSEFKN